MRHSAASKSKNPKGTTSFRIYNYYNTVQHSLDLFKEQSESNTSMYNIQFTDAQPSQS